MPNFDKSKGFTLKSGNKPLFKHMAASPKSPAAMYGKTPAKKTLVGDQANLPEHLKSKIEAAPGKMHEKTPAKHIRRREGHMDTYGTHTNADHPNYWTKGEDGKTPKSKEVAGTATEAKTETVNNTKKTDNTEKVKPKKKNFLGKLKSKIKDVKEKVETKVTEVQDKIKAGTEKRLSNQKKRNHKTVWYKNGRRYTGYKDDKDLREKIKADKNPGESTYQYNIRKRKENS